MALCWSDLEENIVQHRFLSNPSAPQAIYQLNYSKIYTHRWIVAIQGVRVQRERIFSRKLNGFSSTRGRWGSGISIDWTWKCPEGRDLTESTNGITTTRMTTRMFVHRLPDLQSLWVQKPITIRFQRQSAGTRSLRSAGRRSRRRRKPRCCDQEGDLIPREQDELWVLKARMSYLFISDVPEPWIVIICLQTYAE